MKRRIKAGDIVRLKSGSPRMVVAGGGDVNLRMHYYLSKMGVQDFIVPTGSVRKCWFGFI
jgi:uncharacterized protein YodC (DUF2158 family)